MATAAELRADLRMFMRDKEDLNFVRGEEEFTDAELDKALEYATMEWNNTPPPIGSATVTTHPAPNLLMMGGALWLMASDSIRSIRNPHAFSDGGIQVSELSKIGNSNVVQGPMRAQYERTMVQIKTNMNIMAGFGGVPGEYSGSYYSSGW